MCAININQRLRIFGHGNLDAEIFGHKNIHARILYSYLK